jgi:type IV secretory pathway VirB10-like protein
MLSKPVLIGLLAAGCIVAAAGGSYLATRQYAAGNRSEAVSPVPAPQPAAGTQAAPRAVDATEGLIGETGVGAQAPAAAPAQPAAPAVSAPSTPSPAEVAPKPAKAPGTKAARAHEATGRTASRTKATETPAPTEQAPSSADAARAASQPVPGSDVTAAALPPQLPSEMPAQVPLPPEEPQPTFEELVVPADSVVGLQLETPLNSDTAHVEDRVEARVTREVKVGDRVAIPAGSRVLGSVTQVEKGGKFKERARLGIRFHTLVLADGVRTPINTDTVYREGVSPASESAAKVGGAAVGGAILGAILGGRRGAAIGGAIGAAGGGAAVAASDRNAVKLPAGTVVTVRLLSPVSVTVEK